MKLKVKNNKGFTLIELLVTIALMLTILGIAIVSFISVSDRKKEEAWRQVIVQIETAAKEFFMSNEYLFEGLTNGSLGSITVGKLVEEDYLSKVVDPRDGKAVNECSYVKVTKINGNYKASYTTEVLDEEACDVNNSMILVKEPGAPSLAPMIDCEEGNQNWCVSDATINLKINTNNNGKIKDIIQDSGSSLCDLNVENETLTCNNEGESNISVTVTNVSGKSAKWSSDLKIDKTAPNIENVALWSQNSSYNSNATYGSFKITDNVSGIDNVTSNVPNNQGATSWNKDGLKEWNVTGYKGMAANSLNGTSVIMHITATDIAGNESSADSNNYLVYEECSNTDSNSEYSGSCTNNGYRTNNTSVVDVNTGKSCSSTSTKVDCSISDIAVMLNTADAERDDNPGMSGIGPKGTRSGKGIFDCDGSYDYDNRFKRGINSITLNVDEDATLDEQWSVAWSHNWMTYAGSACMNVGDFERRLVYRIKWNDDTMSNYIYTKVREGFNTSDYTSKLFTERKDKGIQIKINEDNSYLVNRDCRESDLSAGVRAETCGSVDTSTPNLTKHVYYLSYGSVSSNKLAIYTKYFRSY